MKKLSKALLVLTLGLSLPAALIANNQLELHALDDYVNADGDTQYGWNLVANETNATTWEFDENGDVSYCWAADGDISAQRVYNYALRNLEIEGDDSYSVSATFVPDPDSDLSAERTYGIVCWYQDADNYLLYWLQTKTDGCWSGQFYGRIDSAFRMMYMPQKYQSAIAYTDSWRKGEYYDMWWDQPANSHSELVGQKSVLLTTTVGLKVVSDIQTITVGGTETTCRRFELHQIVGGIDEISCEFYVKQLNAESGGFYTGVYSEMFNIGIEDFTIECTNTDFTKPLVAEVAALPETVASEEDIEKINAARGTYEGLLSYKESVPAETLTKLEAAEASVITYVDNRIAALDKTQSTFLTDLDAVLVLYESLSIAQQDSLTNIDLLSQAIEDADGWVDPNAPVETPSDSSQPSENPSDTPSQPGEEPSEPGEEPSQPGEEPSQPSEEPSQPSEEPSEPSVQPSEPSVQPSEPSVQPSEPSEPQGPTEEPKKGCKGAVAGSFGLMGALAALFVLLKNKHK